ncbi:mitochondrial carrier [Basidiobolus meristosporus CBS 931.73]|uniref:Mitochondrial carrier n=1 Tax=Basidiobolus meristosporus CBS 931.73 TaxID=1314790 RepID=A0A1Y1X5L0_9FUNG|nr:mitochondrial carrier [Basidiobolus meristosporus CBS 931.73]|eukprot:ORX80948.1 mitochondrial carrier [Basidiobolus meristosporus CBS 931.73]
MVYLSAPVPQVSPSQFPSPQLLSNPLASPTKPATGRREKKSLDYVVRTFLAGGIAGCAAKTVVAPMDRVKILFQSSNPHFVKYTGTFWGVLFAGREIYQSTGVRGLFQGHMATLLRIFPYAAIKFVAYEQFKNILVHSKAADTPGKNFVAGSLAGLSSVFCTYPLELIRVRMAYEVTHSGKGPGVYDTFRGILREGSTGDAPRIRLGNLYRGFALTVLGVIPYAGVSFWTHSFVQDWIRAHFPHQILPTDDPHSKPRLKAIPELISGGIAGAVAQTVSYPIEVTRRRVQVRGAISPENNKIKMKEVVKQIYRNKGITGFFVGLSIGYLKVAPLGAVSFYTYERMKWVLDV